MRLYAQIYFAKQYFYLKPITCGRKLVEIKMGDKIKKYEIKSWQNVKIVV